MDTGGYQNVTSEKKFKWNLSSTFFIFCFLKELLTPSGKSFVFMDKRNE